MNDDEVRAFGNPAETGEQYFSAVFDSGYLGSVEVPFRREVLLRPS